MMGDEDDSEWKNPLCVEKDIETVYCVKYALTTGVYKVTGREEGLYFNRYDASLRPIGVLSRGQWARTEPAAIHAVRKLIVARRASLLKELAKLDAIEHDLSAGVLPLAKDDK